MSLKSPKATSFMMQGTSNANCCLAPQVLHWFSNPQADLFYLSSDGPGRIGSSCPYEELLFLQAKKLRSCAFLISFGAEFSAFSGVEGLLCLWGWHQLKPHLHFWALIYTRSVAFSCWAKFSFQLSFIIKNVIWYWIITLSPCLM